MDTTLALAVDSLIVAMPSDSAGLVAWLGKAIPGLAPELVILLAAWLATRGIWLIKLLVTAVKIVGPGPIAPIFKSIQAMWSKLGWILNPAIMYLLGTTVVGLPPVWSIIFSFAGIGVREWLVKSPIPTSKEELMKFKAKVAILTLVALSLFVPMSAHALGNINLPPNIALAIGGGHESNFHDGNTVNSPFIGSRLGYVVSKHLKVEAEAKYIFEQEAYAGSNYSRLSLGAYITF